MSTSILDAHVGREASLIAHCRTRRATDERNRTSGRRALRRSTSRARERGHPATSAARSRAGSNGRRSSISSPTPDELDRQPELVRDRDGHAALGRAVELRQRDAGHAGRLAEQPRLLQAVLPGRRVDDEQRLVRRALEPALDHAPHLGELLHQVRLRVQAAGGVDDHDVPAPRASAPRSRRRRRRRGRRRAGAPTKSAPARSAQISSCSSAAARNVSAGAEDDGAAVLAQLLRELADRRRLARAVDADDEDHGRPRAERRASRGCAEQRLDLLGERLTEVGQLTARLEPPHDLGRRRHADISVDQRLLEPLPRLLVAGSKPRRELGRQRPPALRERVAQPPEETRLLGLVAQPVAPRRRGARPRFSTRPNASVGASGRRGARPCVVAAAAAGRRSARRRRRPSSRRRGRRPPPSCASGA